MTAGHRPVVELTVVLLAYSLLGLLLMRTDGSPLQYSLAIGLALLGSGYSLAAVLFPRPVGLDRVERAGLAAGLSLAVGGALGFALARSSLGFRLAPFLMVSGLFNVGCWAVAWYRQGGVAGNVVAVVLIALLAGGGWVLGQAALGPGPEPSKAEFFLLGPGGLPGEYPDVALVGEPLELFYGIVNREQETVVYQVRALLVDGEMVGRSQPVSLDPGGVQVGRIELLLLEHTLGIQKVDFVLLREEAPLQSLYLWIEVVRPTPSPTPTGTRTPTPTPTRTPTSTPTPSPTPTPTRRVVAPTPTATPAPPTARPTRPRSEPTKPPPTQPSPTEPPIPTEPPLPTPTEAPPPQPTEAPPPTEAPLPIDDSLSLSVASP